MEIPILYESKWILAINKPPGLLTERSPYFASVEDWTAHYLQKNTPKPFVGIVHRLDRVVSGALVLAKRKAALKALHEQFRERRVEKIYWALVENAPVAAAGTLQHWLRPDPKHKKAVLSEANHQEAALCHLDYKMVRRTERGALLEIRLHTGKFHQIRAQLAAIECPIVGDAKYGATSVWQPDSIALHAARLQFTDPCTQQTVRIEAPPPDPSLLPA